MSRYDKQTDKRSEVKATLFDGYTLEEVPLVNGLFDIRDRVSRGTYGVLFITRDRFLSRVMLFNEREIPENLDKVELEGMKNADNGILAGVVFTPARGGKLKEYSGIFRVFSGVGVTVSGGEASYGVETNKEGIFTVVIPKGEYTVLSGPTEVRRVNIKAGSTTIVNIRRGAVLID